MKFNALFLALLFITLTHQHTLKCLFDQLNVDLRAQSAKETPDRGAVQPGPYHEKGRLLQLTPARIQFRIYLDSTLFNDPIPAGQNGAATTTTTNLNFILKSMQITQEFYQSRLKVGQTNSITSPTTCVDFTPPSLTVGSADLILYLRYLTDSTIAYGATGKSCKYFPGTATSGSPDVTLQVGRPTVGRIIFNTYKLVDQESTLTNRVFQSLTSTSLHQTMHILGFDSTLYSIYLDPNVGAPYTSTPLIVGAVNSNRPATNFMTTPFVLAWAKNFFACSNLTGMPLQNEDGASSHWQRTAMYDQMMTGTALGTAKYFSGLTFALLKDMGWYSVDDTFAQTSNYGYQKGCTFVLDACYGTSFTQFCTNTSHPTTNSYCDSNFIGKAICSSGASVMADGCGVLGEYSSCIDPNTQPTSYDIYSYEAYGANSFCLDSTLGSVTLPSTLLSRCYPFVCNTDNIVFTIGTYSITCLSTEAGAQKTLSALAGYLKCPIYTQFCTISRKSCAGFCNQNGYCMNSICNCGAGFYGSDCTQTSCTTGQYYNPTDGSCGTSCPSGYYDNIYSHSCEPCLSPCLQCLGSPTNCMTCQPVNGAVQYFYNSSCYSACPTSTYALVNNTCEACDTVTAQCLDCTGNPTTCTSCQPGLYLSQPVSGNCVTSGSCSAPYILQDEVNMVCVASCASNMYAFGNGSCVMCAIGTFYATNPGQCNTTCSSGFYEDSTYRSCQTCHTECLDCDGPYPQNCTACKSTSGTPYLLLKMCWAICPKGLYANPSAGTCVICPVQLFCTACSYHSSNSSTYCTSCQYGTFYQASTSLCGTTCLSTQYKNTWNNSCNSCDPACATCNGPTSTSCLSCANTFLLLVNSTGGSCLTACPTLGYIPLGVNCQTCDSTCSTCNGVSASQCANCSANYYYYLGYCRYVCPNGTYPNSTTWQCLNCDITCSYCFGGTVDSCTSCATGLYLYNFTCSNSCPGSMRPNAYNVCFQTSLALPLLTLLMLLILIAL